jgi:hypothetical protein
MDSFLSDMFAGRFNHIYYGNTGEFNVDVDEITEDDTKAVQPNCAIKLRPHQLSLLQKCIDFETSVQYLSRYSRVRNLPISDTDYFKTNVGIIGDRVGSGKSYVMLSIIMANDITAKELNIVKTAAFNQVQFHFFDATKAIKTNMIVIPHNLSYQWDLYIKKFGFAESFKYKVMNKLKLVEDFVDEEAPFDYDLLLVTSTYYNKVCEFFLRSRKRLQRVFFDEVDNLNIPGCCRPDANFVWFVTASYGNLLYPRGYSRRLPDNRYMCCANGIRNTGFLRNMFYDLCASVPSHLMKLLVIKNSEAYTESSLQLPSLTHHIIKCRTPSTIHVLNGLVDRNIIDSLNAGDINGALSFVSQTNKGSEDNIVTIVLDKLNKQVINLNLRLNMTAELAYDDERDREVEQNLLKKRLEDVQNKMNQITERITKRDECSICLMDISNKTVTNCCQNVFCFKCINMWLTQKAVCPICKGRLMTDMLYVVSNDGDNSTMILKDTSIKDDEVHEMYDKLKNMEILLKKNPKRKILIFSNYDCSLYQTIPILNKLNIRHDFIKGNADQIRAIVNRYKSNNVDVLLVNTRNYGTGLNLENTDDIIMFHKFDTQLESQVIGRAYRLGRQEPLNVYYLLHENEMSHA